MEVQPPPDLFGALTPFPPSAPPAIDRRRSARARWVGFILLGGLALLAFLNARWMRSPHPTSVPTEAAEANATLPLPDIQMPLLDGGQLALAKQHGHPLVLVFFATWCGPCLEELPAVVRAHDALARHNVPLYAVSVDGPTLDEARDQVNEFRAHHPNPLPVAFDLNVLSTRYRVATIPRTLVFDGNGHLAHLLDGPQEADSIIDAVDGVK